MNADNFDLLTERVLSAVLEISNTLGAGLLEMVYEWALLTELRLRGIRARAPASCSIICNGRPAGEYIADILVEDVLAIELKCVERLTNEDTAQSLNYLRAPGLCVCLLVNFQKPKVEWKRIVHRVQIAELIGPRERHDRRRDQSLLEPRDLGLEFRLGE
jgi:GxxExxY protein